MKSSFPLLLLVLLLPLLVHGQLPPVGYAKSFGASGQNSIYDIHTLAGGENILCGYYSANLTLGTSTLPNLGGSDGLVTKTDAQGNFLWAKALSGPGDEIIKNVKVDAAGNIIVVGEFEAGATFSDSTLTNLGDKDGFVAKLSPEGELVWIRAISNPSYAVLNEVDLDSLGNIYVFGDFNQTLTVGSITLTTGASYNVLLIKYSPEGIAQWAKTFGGNATKSANGIAVLPNGESFLTGSFQGVMQIGSNSHSSNGLSDIFLAKYDTDGNPVWSTTLGGTGTDNGFAITTNALGEVFLGGCFMNTMQVGSQSLSSNGQWDVFVSKFSAEGVPQWSSGFGGTLNDRLNDLLIDSQGNVYGMGWYQNTMVVGSQSLTSLGNFDVFIFQLNAFGNPVDAFSFGGTSQDVGAAMGLDSSGNIYLCGHFFGGPMQVGTITVPQINATNFFLVKLGNSTTFVNPESRHSPLIRVLWENPDAAFLMVAGIDGEVQFFSSTGKEILIQSLKEGEKIPLKFPSVRGILFYRFVSQAGMATGKILIE